MHYILAIRLNMATPPVQKAKRTLRNILSEKTFRESKKLI